MKTLKLSWLFVTFCILFSGTTFAQQIKIRGIVLDELDEPVVGASVIATPAYGTITDVNGSFELSVEKSIKSLEISYIGYQTQKVAVATNLKIKLKPDTQQLDEVLVVAYGTTKKSSFTGSASVVRSDEIKKFQGTGFTDALQGLTAGVNVSQDASNPGAEARISIRGIANMAGNTTPLYVVDGVPYDGSLNSINTNDIASLTVLKDAAAASLYGSRAANGVVIITTKTGKAGKVKVNFNASWGTSDNAVGYGKKADPKQTLLLYWEGLYNIILRVAALSKKLEIMHLSLSWVKYLLHKGKTQQESLFTFRLSTISMRIGYFMMVMVILTSILILLMLGMKMTGTGMVHTTSENSVKIIVLIYQVLLKMGKQITLSLQVF